MSASQGRFVIEGKRPDGKPFQMDVGVAEVRGGLPNDAHLSKTFDERVRRGFVAAAQKAGGTVRRIKRVD